MKSERVVQVIGRDRGFTLVEVLAALAISALLMAALYQALDSHWRYTETVTERLTEPQVARVLLHQIADELRSVVAPKVAWPPPEGARSLLALGAVEVPDAGSLQPLEAPSAADEASREEGFAHGAERFGILGTSNRLLMLARRSAVEASSISRYESDRNASIGSDLDGEEDKRSPERWGDLRQIYYLLRPLPEMVAGSGELPQGTEYVNDTDSPDLSEEAIQPYYGGVIRQEVLLPFSPIAHQESRNQLASHLLPQEERIEDQGVEVLSAASEFEREVPPQPQTTTRIVSSNVTAVRFRYHDGQSWLHEWHRHDVLPIAVEISLSFDPRASDPEYLRKYFEELVEPESTEDVNVTRVPNGTDFEPPLFAYRLVVAIPTAVREYPQSHALPSPETPAAIEEAGP